MCDGNDGSLILLKVLLQPVDRLCIEVVRRFIEQQYVGLLQEQSTESHTTTLATGEVLHRPIGRRTVERSHGTLKLGVHVPCVCGIDDVLQLSLATHQFLHLVGILVIFRQAKLLIDFVVFSQRIIDVLHAFHHILTNGLRLVKRRILRQIAHAVAWAPHNIALILLVESCYDFQKGGLTGTIKTNNTYLCTIEKAEIDVLKHLFLVLLDGLTHSHHREDYFLVIYCCHKFFCLQFFKIKYRPASSGVHRSLLLLVALVTID